MIERQQLLKDLQALLPKIEQDILAYAESDSERSAHLKEEYANAKAAKRTAEHFVDWRASQITQAAAAWILTCVFVRFLEDNALLDEPMIAGPAGDRLQHAKDRLSIYFREQPTHAERDYLLSLFTELERLPAMAELLDRRHNPLWQLPVSADGARLLIDFFQKLDPASGALLHDFTDPDWDTRFLGDLYQDLSESVRKRYALLQTPEFVESFILDYTLEKAKDTFGLPGLRLIDPTCGSGHFLLTSFERLFSDWLSREPSTNSRALAQRALDSVYGVDINPYAVAIARFRLLVAAMKASQCNSIKSAPDFHFNLAVGDSLLHGRRHESQGQGIQVQLSDDPIAHVFDVEDRDTLERIFGQRYHVVVGNPPYITVKDKALNAAYRGKYPTCHMKYSLGVPFTERFFDLTLPSVATQPPGYLGMITTNSFMKREFGKKLIEAFLPKKDLTHIIDTSGAYIPGHGTPTVILFARNAPPRDDHLRAVLGIRGEPTTPKNPARGRVWQSILAQLHEPGSESDFVSVVDQMRQRYAVHPWSLSGGGASDLRAIIEEKAESRLHDRIDNIGFLAILGEDDAFAAPPHVFRKTDGPARDLAVGEIVRDWVIDCETQALFPYLVEDGEVSAASDLRDHCKFLWLQKARLKARVMFGKTPEQHGHAWFEYMQHISGHYRTPFSIAFAFVATHNHFVLDRGGKVFNRSAPVIKLPAGSTEADHLALLGLLNSSTACFWMKQVFHNKGGGGIGGGLASEEWEQFYEFTGTGLKNFPIPGDTEGRAAEMAHALDRLARDCARSDPAHVLEKTVGSASALTFTPRTQPGVGDALLTAKSEVQAIARSMISQQEELDWYNYFIYGLLEMDLTCKVDPPSVKPGARAFEIYLARRSEGGETATTWFDRHSSTPMTECPTDWSEDYTALVNRRLEAIKNNKWIRLIEQPEYKRRWKQEPWDKRVERALREWLLDRLEALCHDAELLTCAQLADRTRSDTAFQAVAGQYRGNDTFDPQLLVSELVAAEHVPQMAAARYKPKALPKFRAWQSTWDKQRAEDAIDARTKLDSSDPQYLDESAAAKLKAKEVGEIPLPPKYGKADFAQATFWTLRGKLDVPKERFFSLPGCEKDGDSTLVLGWAGLNHLQRAQAIAAWYLQRKEQEGWPAERLTPMLVALDELIPWLKQWHNDIDPEFGERLGDYYEGFLLEELRQLELPRSELVAWRPAPARATRRRRKKK